MTNAHLINSGRLPVVNEDPEFRFVEIEDEAQGAEKISALYNSELLETGDKFAVQVLSPMYKNPCGVDNLNQLIQGRFNPPAEEKGELKGKNVIFRVGDKVMQKHNDYEKGVFNGDIGEIFAIQKDMVYVRYPEQDVKYEGRKSMRLPWPMPLPSTRARAANTTRSSWSWSTAMPSCSSVISFIRPSPGPSGKSSSSAASGLSRLPSRTSARAAASRCSFRACKESSSSREGRLCP